MQCWQVLGLEAEESKDTQYHPHLKAKAKESVRSRGVNGDLQIFSEPGSLF